MLGLQNQDLEHHDRVKRRTAALAAIGITQYFDQPDPEILKVHGPFQNLQRIAIAAQHLNMVIQAERDVGRSEESSVGKECGRRCRAGWGGVHEKKKDILERDTEKNGETLIENSY